MTHKDSIKARKFKRAMILIKANESLTDLQIVEALNVSHPGLESIRKRFIVGDLELMLNEDPRSGHKRKLDGRGEAWLFTTATSVEPSG